MTAAAAEAAGTVAFTDTAITNLEAHQGDFEAADDIPVPFLPLTVAPALTLLLGAALLVAGVLALLRPAGRAAAAIVFAVGALLVVFTVVGDMSRKVNAADDLIDSLNITEASAVETRHRLEVQLAGARELDGQVLPDLQARLGLDDRQFAAYLGDTAPALAALRGDFERRVERFEIDVRIREQGNDEFEAIRDVPTRSLPWVYFLGGLVAAGCGTVSLLRRRPLETTPARPPGPGVTTPTPTA